MADTITPIPTSSGAVVEVDPDSMHGLTASVSPTKMAVRRFLHHKAAVISTVVLTIIALAVILAPLIAPYAQNERIPGGLLTKPPSSQALFGTDSIGRDLFSRILWGGRVSLLIGIMVAVVSSIIGTLVGSWAGFRGGTLDDVLMRMTDIVIAFPLLVLLLVLAQLPTQQEWARWLLGDPKSIRLIVTILSVTGWTVVARIVRGVVLSLKEKEFVEAARAMGATDWRIISRHLIPNALGPIVVTLTFGVAGAIGAESTISFFGLGVDPLTASWGNLLTDSRTATTAGYWWLILFPVVALLLTILAINFIGDGLRDALDPKQGRDK